MFSFPEKAGLLFHCLSVFALRDLNLTKIESRPLRDDPVVMDPEIGRKFQFRFHIDFAGSLAQTSVQNAIVHLKVSILHAPAFLNCLGLVSQCRQVHMDLLARKAWNLERGSIAHAHGSK